MTVAKEREMERDKFYNCVTNETSGKMREKIQIIVH